MSMRDFSFNGVSLRSLGGRITEKPYHTIAKRRIDRVKIYGRSGDDFVDGESYENVDFSVKIALLPYINGQTAQQAARAVIDWLAPLQNSYYQYTDSENEGYFTQAVLLNFDQIVREMRTMLTATLRFSRLPYWYSNAGATETKFYVGNAQNTLTNPEQYDSEPVYHFHCDLDSDSNAVLITANGQTASFATTKGAGDYYIDNVKGQMYWINNGTKAYLPLVQLPNLVSGSNSFGFSLNSGISGSFNLGVTPNWRRL